MQRLKFSRSATVLITLALTLTGCSSRPYTVVAFDPATLLERAHVQKQGDVTVSTLLPCGKSTRIILMSCCCPHSNSANRFFSRFAGQYRKRFESKGFEPSQKHLLEGLTKAGFEAANILEIGSGVGHLHQTMLERGAASAVGIDLASKMIEEARHWATERQLQDKVRYVEGDFMDIADDFSKADVTVLDKVVCCYPDAKGLVNASLAKTNRVYALTYPRDRWFVRLMMGSMALFMKIIRSDFRPYVHSPLMIENWISESGFVKDYQNTNMVWLTQVYVRPAI